MKKKSCLVFCSSTEPQRVNMKLVWLLTEVLVVTLQRVIVCLLILSGHFRQALRIVHG